MNPDMNSHLILRGKKYIRRYRCVCVRDLMCGLWPRVMTVVVSFISRRQGSGLVSCRVIAENTGYFSHYALANESVI